MPISFPTSPTTNQTYTYLGKTWTWTGAVWQANSTPMGPTGPTGPTGAASTVTGPTGPTGPAYVSAVSNWAASASVQSSDASKLIRTTSGTALTITIPNVLTVGQQIDFIQYGTGQITFAGSGITLNSAGGKLKTSGQYSAASVICVASGVYALIGDIAA